MKMITEVILEELVDRIQEKTVLAVEVNAIVATHETGDT